MLTSIRIQNFRSIRDAEVKLGQVNLFIGPNNSGKSNFLKGIELVMKSISKHPWTFEIKEGEFSSSIFRRQEVIDLKSQIINFDCKIKNKYGNDSFFNINFKNIELESRRLEFRSSGLDTAFLLDTSYTSNDKYSVIYKPDPAKFLISSNLSNDSILVADASNLVSFIFNLSQNHKSRFKQLENDLARCVGDLVSISTPADPMEAGKLKLKFFDTKDNGYWAEEVSEGVLYFLALLCIVHQPDPPKLILLEEPEKGIHPRRITEIMNFIFELAEMRDIQIILTSHSPYVVDHFADIPECISVFDRKDGETVVRNAADIIEETNAKLNKPIRYSDALGEHWVSGFLGGVPA